MKYLVESQVTTATTKKLQVTTQRRNSSTAGAQLCVYWREPLLRMEDSYSSGALHGQGGQPKYSPPVVG